MAKSKVLERPMFKGAMPDEPVMDVENVGIMQGFKDLFADEDPLMPEEDMEMAELLGRAPDSPEILMNNLRGDMRSVDARRDELADLVGYQAAEETPEPVLAMLQPVLAQQGGIGALPVPGAAPPGPPPGMPPGPEMGMMPPEMGMPPGPEMGGMPPPEMPPGPPPEMPPGGGIAGLPVGQPPLQMAQGGLVQYFSRGTTGPDEDQDGGVSQREEPSAVSVLSMLPPGLRAQAESAFISSLRKPAQVSDLKQLSGDLAKQYAEILGTDRKAAQAQMLLELGQRAFGYAANVDDQGRPLRGGQLARLAGAVRTLPTAVGKFTAEMDKEDRAIKLAGVQAAEKQIQAEKEQQAKQQKNLADLYKEFIRADAKAAAAGAGVKGTPFNQYQELITRAAEGTLDEPGKIRLINTVTQMVQPTEVTVTDKFGNVHTEIRRADIPRSFFEYLSKEYGQEAANNWLRSLGDGIKISPIAYPMVTGQGAGTTAPGTTAPGQVRVVDTDEGQPTVEGAQRLVSSYQLPNTDPGRETLWPSRRYIAGPINAAEAFFARNFPDADPNIVDKVRQDALKANEGLIKALATNEDGRLSNDEQARLRSIIALSPRVFGGEGAMSTALVSIDDALLKERANHIATINSKDVLASAQSRARVKVNLIDNYRASLGVPPSVYRQADLESIPVGQEFVDKRNPNQFDIRRKDTFSYRSEEAIKNFQAQNPRKPYAVVLPSGKIQLYTAPGKAR